jgi:hypothetical protein
MIEPSDAKEVKNDYLEILEALIQKIHRTAKDKGLNPSRELSISVGTEKIYKGLIGDNSLDKINPFVSADLVEKLNTAISNPRNLKGTVSIKVGQSEVFRVKNGKVETDKLGLSQSQTQRKAPEERTYSVEALQKQVEVLQRRVEEQQKLVDRIKADTETPESLAKLFAQVEEMSKSLSKQQKAIEKTQQALSQVSECSLPPIQNTQLQNWVGAVEIKLKQTARNVFERVKDALTPEVTKVRNKIEEMKSQVSQQVKNLKDEFTRAIDDVKSKTIEGSVRALLKHLGTKNPDGSITFQSKSFDFQQRGENVTVRAKDGNEVLENGVLSPTVSERQIEALDKVQSVVDKYNEAEQEYLSYAEQESESLSRGWGMSR